MFTYKSSIRYSEIDRSGTLSVPALINYFQDTSNFHAESAGIGWKMMLEQHRAWLLCFWQLQVDRYPELGETVTVESRPYAYDGLFGRRCFGMRDEAGAYLAMADSLWFIFDDLTGHPVMKEEQFVVPFGQDAPLDMELIRRRRLVMPAEMRPGPAFDVRRDQLDTNFHVNNSRYIAMAEEYFPEEKPARLRIEYKTAAKYGDRICPWFADEGDSRFIALRNEAGEDYALLQLGGIGRTAAAERFRGE